MYVTRIQNRDSPPAVLLRESYREGGKVKSRTLASISDWPEAKIDSLRRVLAGETLAPLGAERFEIARALAHGHVAAVLGTVRRLGLDKALPKGPERRAKLILAMIVARIIEPAAKLATARQLSEATAAHSLGAVLGLGEVDEDELYAALDLLGRNQSGIEKFLAQRHLEDGVLVLYDVTSSYLEGRRCELAQFGYSRDHRRDRPQIVFGLLCTTEGCPVAVEVFEGNLGDPGTLANQVRKLRMRFRLKRIVLVGDRGMITQARIDADLEPAGFDWITALRAPAIQALAASGGRCSCRCSTSATWRKSPPTTTPASVSSSVATPNWRPSARASAPSSSRRPRRRWPRSARRPSESAIRSAARTRSASGSAP